MAHLVLQLGTALVVPMTTPRHKRVNWRGRALREATRAAGDAQDAWSGPEIRRLIATMMRGPRSGPRRRRPGVRIVGGG